MIIINDTLGVYGGTQTQILRMCRWFVNNGEKAAVICESTSNTEITSQLKELHIPYYEIGISNVDDTGKYIKKYHAKYGDQLRVINFTWNHYLDVEVVKNRYKIRFNNFLYCVHPKAVYKGDNIKIPILKKIYMSMLKKLLLRMNKNEAVVFMDEADIESSEEYFDIPLFPIPEIFRVPMDFHDNPDWRESASKSYYQNTIMTVSRAEFPFKGYMLGLIDDYELLFGEFPGLKLVIVSSGDDLPRLEKKIIKLDKKIKDSIELHHWMPNDRLQKEMEKCKIYIGMGTTILDASRAYRPAIPVRFYTNDNIAEHFVGDRPEYIVCPESSEQEAIDLLRKVLLWDKDTYLEACQKSYMETKRLYDENVILKRWTEKDNKDKRCLLNTGECLMHYCYQKANTIRFKNIKTYDYECLEKEK